MTSAWHPIEAKAAPRPQSMTTPASWGQRRHCGGPGENLPTERIFQRAAKAFGVGSNHEDRRRSRREAQGPRPLPSRLASGTLPRPGDDLAMETPSIVGAAVLEAACQNGLKLAHPELGGGLLGG